MAVTTSTTEINAIDQTYPVAGQDNDSQGFRDNFSNIKTSLTKVKADLDALDTNTAKLNVSNDFNGNQISEADFNKIPGLPEYVNADLLPLLKNENEK